MNTPTIDQSRRRAKTEKLQAHWEVPGHVARVYNIAKHTAYTVRVVAGVWTCDCAYGQYGHAPCKHLVAVVDKVRREQRKR